ncbi:unnamed protein product [Durusdinium trenchii]|uniref:Non-specific serine/threonine protein kinase n=1 Tax=Durusdinium trenchii TaxID=1381693 RepID=A0ABP0PJ11_9DINO
MDGVRDFLNQWSEYLSSSPLKTDSHLNDASNEYSEEELNIATESFDKKCLLGSGSFGQVYKGTMKDGTEVAIKVLQVPNEGGFEEEVRVLSRFRHPNLVILMGFARHAETGWRSLIYEFLSGGDVAKRIAGSRQKKEPFSGQLRVSVALDAACGLSHLHNMTPRAFHRDIKSQNILLDKYGTAKMADFGLACLSSAPHHKVRRVGGTVGYACPEYLRTGVISEGSEVYSFGILLLELLTGVPPAVCCADRPGEYKFLVDFLQGSQEKVQQMLDPTAGFSTKVFEVLCSIAFRCINSRCRPLFKQLVEELRHLHSDAPDVPRAAETSAASQASVGQWSSSALCVGAAVEVRWRGGNQWYQGWILRQNPDSTAAVKYNDGQLEDHVPLSFLRLPGSQVSPSPPSHPTAASSVAELPQCQLKCVYAEGVTDTRTRYLIKSAPGSSELLVGRTAQLPSFWDFLVPEKELQSRVSRKHFKILCRQHQLADGQNHPVLFLQCLSPNGLVLNDEFLGPDAGEKQIQDGDTIALASCRLDAGTEETFSSAAGWAVPKPFLVFELEVPDPKRKHSENQQALLSSRQQPHGEPVQRSTGVEVFNSAYLPWDSASFVLQGSVRCEPPIPQCLRSSS